MENNFKLRSWLTPRRLFWLFVVTLLTIAGHVFESSQILSPLRAFTNNIGQSLNNFDATSLGNRFYSALTGCRFTGPAEHWYVCDGAPFYKRYVIGNSEPFDNECVSYLAKCISNPTPPKDPYGLNYSLWSRWHDTCTTQGQPVCAARKIHVPAIVYPVFVPGHILYSTLTDIWSQSSTLGAILFILLTLIAGLIIAANLDWDDGWYWRLALLLLLTPALASVMAFGLKLILLFLILVFSAVLAGIAWVLAFGWMFKSALAIFGVFENAKKMDEMTAELVEPLANPPSPPSDKPKA